MSSSVIGIIPARYGSTRFPGKALAKIQGKEMIRWVVEAAQRSRMISKLAVATDDERIKKCLEPFGVTVIMTSVDCPSGTDRVWEAAKAGPEDIIVNIQGDEPLLVPEMLDALVRPLLNDANLNMATLAHEISNEELNSLNSVKVLVDQNWNAIYFSRFPIPYSRIDAKQLGQILGAWKHIGLYAYRRGFLEKYCAQKPVEIENAESLEQLRALYLGAKIRVIPVKYRSWGVDAPEDLKKIEELLRTGGGPI